MARKGDEHERAYLESLRAAGREVAVIVPARARRPGGAAEQTRPALRSGAEVIYHVARMWRSQITRLRERGITRVSELARDGRRPAATGKLCAFERLGRQARLQVDQRANGRLEIKRLRCGGASRSRER